MKFKGGDKHVARLRKLAGKNTERVVTAVLYEGADMIAAEAKRSISAGSISGKDHVASRPGEAPNPRYGRIEQQDTGEQHEAAHRRGSQRSGICQRA